MTEPENRQACFCGAYAWLAIVGAYLAFAFVSLDLARVHEKLDAIASRLHNRPPPAVTPPVKLDAPDEGRPAPKVLPPVVQPEGNKETE